MSVLLVQILIFTITSFVNVILGTSKSIFTVGDRGDWSAGVINGISFGFNNIITNQVADYPLWMTVTITTVTNIFGVVLARRILRKTEKDKVWKISVTTEDEKSFEMIPARLASQKIGCNYSKLHGCEWKGEINIFSYSKEESKIVKEILKDYNVKYFATEGRNL